MAEKKKRWRPSLTAYRALENEVSELKEQLALAAKGSSASKELKALREKYDTLEKSNKYLEDSRDALVVENESLVKENEILKFENTRLKERGFWARVFNK